MAPVVFRTMSALAVAFTTIEAASISLEFTLRDFAPSYCLAKTVRDDISKGVYVDESGTLNTYYDWRGLIVADRYSFTANQCSLGGNVAVSSELNIDNVDISQVSGHPDFATYRSNGLVLDITSDTLDMSDPSGLGKPAYCNSVTSESATSNDEYCGAQLGNQNNRWNSSSNYPGPVFSTTSGADYFSSWYRDVPNQNKRVAFRQELEPEGNTFTYGSTQYFPLDDCPISGDPRSASTCWGWSDREIAARHKFYFTTELHSFFEYKGNEEFLFKGDDDVWVYIDGKRVIDLGGVHGEEEQTVVLDSLGLVKNEIYTLDMFHAERHCCGSNFRITTSLTESCTVSNSPIETLSQLQVVNQKAINQSTLLFSDVVLSNSLILRGGSKLSSSTGNLVLGQEGVEYKYSHSWFAQGFNIAQGFDVIFSFTLHQNSLNVSGEGLAFVFHRNGLDDLQGGAGGNIGLRGLDQSVAVVLDLCSQRGSNVDKQVACSQDATQLKLTVNGQVVAFDNVVQRIDDGLPHSIRFRYFARPSWMEVLLDDSLYLRKVDVNVTNEIGGTSAHGGFTSGSSSVASNIEVSSLLVSTVGVALNNTRLVELPFNATRVNDDGARRLEGRKLQEIPVADGSTPFGVHLQKFDFCGFEITFGGLGDKVTARLVEDNGTAWRYNNVSNWILPEVRQRLLAAQPAASSGYYNYSTQPTIVDGQIVDTQDGMFTVQFVTSVAAEYTLYLDFNGEPVCMNDGACSPFPGALVFNEFIPTTEPPRGTSPPDVAPQGISEEVVTILGAAGGVLACCFLSTAVILVRYRKDWLINAGFISRGKLAKMDEGVDYGETAALDELQHQLQNTLEEINKLRSKGNTDTANLTTSIEELEAQKAEISEQVKHLKKHFQEKKVEQYSVFRRPNLSMKKRSIKFRSSVKSLTSSLRGQSLELSSASNEDLAADVSYEMPQPPNDDDLEV